MPLLLIAKIAKRISSNKAGSLKLGCYLILGFILSIGLAAAQETALDVKTAVEKLPGPIAEESLEQVDMELSLAQNKLKSLNLEFKEAEQTLIKIKTTIKELGIKLQDAKLASSERNHGNFLVAELTANVNYYRSLLQLEQTRWDVLNNAVKIAEQNLAKALLKSCLKLV